MRSGEDDGARARIRDVAIELIGRDGSDRTSLRAVARAAGVSPGLVVHHFGSWEGLRRACDEYVIAKARPADDGTRSGGDGPTAAIRTFLSDIDASRPWLDYVRRLLLEDSPTGDLLFDELLAQTQDAFAAGVQAGTVRPSADPRTRAVLLTAYGLAALVLQRHVGRALGEPGLTSGAAARLAVPALEIYGHGLYADPGMPDPVGSPTSSEGA